MDPVFRWSFEVAPDAVDTNRHVNNVVYLEWVQEAARRHAEATGLADVTRAAGATWVVREHRLQYLRPAFAGDRVEVRTWVATVRHAQSQRRTEVVRLPAGEVLARGRTDWAFVDDAGGHPRLIPPEVSGLLAVVPEPPPRPGLAPAQM